MGATGAASGPDFSAGIPINDIPEGKTVAGRVGDDPVLLSRFDGELFAVSGGCTHYGAPLGEGLLDGETVRCPWHHACFSLRTGAALRAPALDALDRWKVDVEGGTVFVRSKIDGAPRQAPAAPVEIERVVIVGGGAAGLACASELRRLGYAGAITMVSVDRDPPCDRPNLSKDYLAGTAPEEWLPLRPADWYEQNRIELRLGAEVQRIDATGRRVELGGGEELAYDRLLLATGSEPNRLREPGFDADNVFTLRSIADSIAIAEQAKAGARAVIVGSSFIGMEAAAALRKRGVEVTVVAPEHVPFERVFGAEIGSWLQRLHERNGVRFHLGTVASSLEGRQLKLANGESVEADFVLVGIGVRPRAELAQAAGIPADGAVPVDAFLETSLPGMFAAGDIAAYPDALTREPVRIEHWVHAERQGQVAAANILGHRKRFDAVPFFWTEQFGVPLRYVGHAGSWDRVEVHGDIESGDFIARYYEGGEHRASAAVGRDLEILEDERRFERMIAEKSARSGEPREKAGIESA
jgi:NADPH-dependent 2,4-dienoyl-CoA reductase/sulfur reductase-like enzyme/nitrite reductase/ring-hydroxylating ferredoxin subunit